MDERARLAMLARTLGVASAPGGAKSGFEIGIGVEVGIGDDAAVLLAPGAASRLVWTVDEQVEGVHFRRDFLSFRDIGWRSFMAAASDVAAMGAVPWCALSALVLSDDVDDGALENIACGQREAADAIGAPVVGGNLSRRDGEHGLSIATSLLGTCDRAVQRRGARGGDALWLAGRVGCAAAGLKAIERAVAADERVAVAVAAWRTPRALVAEGQRMATVAHAAVDVSDGLARDAGHVGEASGVCIVLDESALVADEALIAAAAALGENALDLALYGGEDYALVAASTVAIAGFRRIGEVREGSGLFLRAPDGERAIAPKGFDHFARST
jgi:thiamine-monophosphate kinase